MGLGAADAVDCAVCSGRTRLAQRLFARITSCGAALYSDGLHSAVIDTTTSQPRSEFSSRAASSTDPHIARRRAPDGTSFTFVSCNAASVTCSSASLMIVSRSSPGLDPRKTLSGVRFRAYPD